MDILKDLLSKYPDNTDIKIALANNYLALGKPNKALNILKDINDLASNIDAQRILGEIYLTTKKYSQALEAFNNVLCKIPKETYSLSKKGQILKNLGLYEDAVKCLKEVIKLKPEDEEIYLSITDIYLKEQNYTQALKQYEKILEKNQDCYSAILGIANVFYNLQQFNNAQEYYFKVIHINPNEHSAYCKIAEILYNDKEYEPALNYIFEAIKLQPNNDYYHYLAAKILCENGILNKALEEYTIAVQNSPGNIAYITEYTDVMFLTGHIEQALKTLKKALRIEKNNTEILKRLILFSDEIKDNKQSEKYQKILNNIKKNNV